MTPLSHTHLSCTHADTPPILTIHALWCSEKAKDFFEEARLVKFSRKVQVYQQQHVALQWRNALQKVFQGVQPRSPLQLKVEAEVFRNELGLLAKETIRVVQPSVTAQVTMVLVRSRREAKEEKT